MQEQEQGQAGGYSAWAQECIDVQHRRQASQHPASHSVWPDWARARRSSTGGLRFDGEATASM